MVRTRVCVLHVGMDTSHETQSLGTVSSIRTVRFTLADGTVIQEPFIDLADRANEVNGFIIDARKRNASRCCRRMLRRCTAAKVQRSQIRWQQFPQCECSRVPWTDGLLGRQPQDLAGHASGPTAWLRAAVTVLLCLRQTGRPFLENTAERHCAAVAPVSLYDTINSRPRIFAT